MVSPPPSHKSLCPYCGVGCGLEVLPSKDNQADSWQVRGDRLHPSSQGMVCVKGATVAEALHQDRLTTPLFRERLDQPFRPIDWDSALDLLVGRLQRVVEQQGADAFCMYGSGQLQTEDYYIAQKLVKGCLGTNNFDTNSRLCMSSAVSAYSLSFGADGPPCCYEDLDLADCVVLIGTNTAECHPILFNRLVKRHKRDRSLSLVVIDPRRTATAEAADLHLAIHPGTDIPLLHGLANLLLAGGHGDTAFIADHTQGFADYQAVLAHYPPAAVAQTCGLSLAELEQAAQLWGQAETVLSLWSMGLNQSQEGTAKARSLIDLHLLTGQVGRAGAGPFSLTGQPNAMGGREVGGLCHLLPGYRQVTNPQHREELEAAWGLPAGQISAQPGRTGWEMITGLETGEVDLLWIVATNPAVSMPDLRRTQAALAQSPFTVYQDCYYPTETAAYAHLVLPAAQWSEKTGVMTNSERVVTLCPGFRPPPGQARPDWEIFCWDQYRDRAGPPPIVLPVDAPAPPVDVPALPVDVPALPVDAPALPVDVPALPVDAPAPPVLNSRATADRPHPTSAANGLSTADRCRAKPLTIGPGKVPKIDRWHQRFPADNGPDLSDVPPDWGRRGQR